MDFIDWLLAIGLVALITVTFGLLLPPYGYIGGALIGAFLAWRALRQRRELLKKQKEDNK
jgi:threonine/homoserine/homoserine lactone efflux protein